jgi:predicted transposase YdaD
MLMAEWDLDDALAVEREEGREEGWEKGREKGREEAIKSLLEFGMKPEQISRALKIPFDVVQRYL